MTLNEGDEVTGYTPPASVTRPAVDVAAILNDMPLIAEARRLREEVRDYQAMRLSDGADLARLHAQRDAALEVIEASGCDCGDEACVASAWTYAIRTALGVTK